ncbi:E3 SUMO-protein ligase KIAA1586-like [Pantherophis guttatus]|uniref:E3 SUMO-protein ligase KIAA1586-like n=1 Tax=Pantherophis guttatus TaxID=94885 RepID=A0A6P9B1B0_PANGU|nr:E3 SUMO-protein ligase KIAA1586-like [Pantherophis guttatus]
MESGIHVSKEWKLFKIELDGKNKEVHQVSLRKKMREHFISKLHTICRDNVKQAEQEAITKAMDKISERQFGTTSKMFKTVYSLAKACIPISSIEELIELQTENGVELGVGLHSRPSVVKIVECITNEIKTQMFSSIIARNLKICLIIDEASTVSCKPVLIVFLKVEDSEDPPNIFVELVELKKQDAETICSAVFESLRKVDFTYKKNLIVFCSDGASVMLGRKSGVSTRIANEFPNIIIWHCLNHRFQLVLDDAIKEIKQVNHLKIFIDKICSIFQQSNKNQIELDEISEELEINIIRIGLIFGPRWATCSLRATIAVWRAYPVLHQYFHGNAKYSGMSARLENKYFLNDLALIIDILEEISLLSTALQARNTDIIKAEKLVRRSIKAFELLAKGKGPYERKVEELITSETFRNINFIENHRFVGLHRERLLQSIIKNLQKQLMDSEHLKTGNQLQDTINKLQFLQFLVPEYWDFEEIVIPWVAAEEQLRIFSDIFNYNIIEILWRMS